MRINMALGSAILICLVLLVLLTWIVLTAAWGSFWQLWRYDADADAVAAISTWPSVVAVVPARNEAETIGATMSGLAQQDYPGEFRIVIVDDHSDDGTLELARRVAEESGISAPIDIISAPPLRAGWTGKVWAMNAGVQAAADLAPEWFWFVDADVACGPDTLRGLMSRAVNQNLSLASLMVLLESKSFAERLLIPPFLYFFLMLYPPRWTNDEKSRTAGSAGGCLLLRAGALESIGGCAAIGGEVIDDCALSLAVKRCGGRVWMGLTRKSVSIRCHQTFSEIRDMIARTAFTQLHYSALGLLGTIAGLAFVFFLPVVLTFTRDPRVWPFALAAWILMSVSFAPTLAYYRVSRWFAPLLPAATLYYGYATVLSAVRYWLGRGGEWKLRSQAPARSTRGTTD
jgi:hopene-associated glycosyltransferase HpnB